MVAIQGAGSLAQEHEDADQLGAIAVGYRCRQPPIQLAFVARYGNGSSTPMVKSALSPDGQWAGGDDIDVQLWRRS
jgi:hypothetical protein